MEKMAATENIDPRGNTYYHVEVQNVVREADEGTSHPSPSKLQKGRVAFSPAMPSSFDRQETGKDRQPACGQSSGSAVLP